MSARRPMLRLEVPVAQHADQAGAGDAAMHLDPPGGELLRHQFRGAVFLEAHFRMRVDVAARGGEVGLEVGDAVVDGQGRVPR